MVWAHFKCVGAVRHSGSIPPEARHKLMPFSEILLLVILGFVPILFLLELEEYWKSYADFVAGLCLRYNCCGIL